MDMQKVREDFPILKTRQHGHPLIYLDNAATMQMPYPVQAKILEHYQNCNANVHRGVHSLSQRSTDAMEAARQTVAQFIGASADEVIFTAGTTDSINQLARMLAGRVKPGQQIVVSAMEHHSNLLPWQELARANGAKLSILTLEESGDLDLDALQKLLQADTALVAVTWCSNVLGTVNPIGEIAVLAHAAGALCVVDGAQGMKLGKTNVRLLDCDFLAFSGHKLGALTGIGVLYGKKAILDTLPPAGFGGGMIRDAGYSSSRYGTVPQRFEAGTPNYVGAISLGIAVEYLTDVGLGEIARREEHMTNRLADELSHISGLQVLGTPKKRSGAVSFYVPEVHAFDLGVMLDTLGIAVRTGHLCAQPLVEQFGVTNVLRVSPAFYNTEEELTRFIAALHRLLPLLRRNAL